MGFNYPKWNIKVKNQTIMDSGISGEAVVDMHAFNSVVAAEGDFHHATAARSRPDRFAFARCARG